ncbi:collagen triple helix repeat-containing protein 1-like [Saccoglossus kowalevskii]|uniref:Collagen triple helix repeat-containing protein 1-like n=1 Tax=Saccoglossus kowalevskii TaxID=10224 RepID=A0ABM0MQZ8_SACKO|nr:PREDICTED: collagen triple helix repeat-containing protein 1-like [Saccoglossus kowalevskii]
MSDNSVLRVVWNGNLRAVSASGSCTRWYFTFNDNECDNPFPIDTSMHTHGSQNMHVGISVEGMCYGIGKGEIRVAFHVSTPCSGHPASDAYTGWQSVSRIIIEEIPIAQ